MTDYASVTATLEGWLRDPTGVDRTAVKALFTSLGYIEQPAADYRGLRLLYRRGWPRYTFVSAEDEVPVTVLQHMATSLLRHIQSDISQ